MKIKYGIIVLIFLFVVSCKQRKGIEYSFSDVQISNSNYHLNLPNGILKSEVEDFSEGIFQHFIYSDESVVIISTNGMGQINLPEYESPDTHWRKEKVDGIQFAYGNVKTERKAEFDKAFDLILKNGIKNK